MEEKQQAIEACACPRAPWETLTAPKCAVELYTGGEGGTLFVNSPPGLYCRDLKPFGHGGYCLSKQRHYVFRKFGV